MLSKFSTDDLALDLAGSGVVQVKGRAGNRTLQQKLTARKHALKPGDANALATYQGQFNRYLTFLNQVRAPALTIAVRGTARGPLRYDGGRLRWCQVGGRLPVVRR